jgi:hypothetical protein
VITDDVVFGWFELSRLTFGKFCICFHLKELSKG